MKKGSKQADITQSSRKVVTKTSKITGTKGTTSKRGGTVTSTEKETNEREIWKDPKTLQEFDVTPEPLIKTKEEIEAEKAKEGMKEGSSQEKGDQSSRNQPTNIASKNEVTESKSKIPGTSFSVAQSSERSQEMISSATSTETDAEDIQKDQDGKKTERIQELNLEEMIDINLIETNTFDIFFKPSIAVSVDAANQKEVEDMNERYAQSVELKKISDNYFDREAQTFNQPVKVKQVAPTYKTTEEKFAFAYTWDIEDYKNQKPLERHQEILVHFRKEAEKTANEILKMKTCLLNAESFINQAIQNSASISSSSRQEKTGSQSRSKGSKQQKSKQKQESSSIDQSSKSATSHTSEKQSEQAKAQNEGNIFLEVEDKRLPDTLEPHMRTVERILTQNRYQKEQIIYRNYPRIKFKMQAEQQQQEEQKDLKGISMLNMKNYNQQQEEEPKIEQEKEEEEESQAPGLSELFNFKCEIAQGRTVSSAD